MIFKPHQALDILKSYLPDNPIIVEAGAFTGSDSVKMANFWPRATIHSFEPVSELFISLQSKTIDYENIECYNVALSDNNGYESLYLSVKPSQNNRITQASSLLSPKNREPLSTISFPKTIPVKTTTLDSWAQENKVENIDLLWLDTQGNELDIIKASPNTLQKTNLIHIEVATIERYHNQPLYSDVKQWFAKHGFGEIAKDFDPAEKSWGNVIFKRV